MKNFLIIRNSIDNMPISVYNNYNRYGKELKYMITIKHVNTQLEKKENVDKVYVDSDGTLIIHVRGCAIPSKILENPDNCLDVSDNYFDWVSGVDNKYNTAKVIADSANDFYRN